MFDIALTTKNIPTKPKMDVFDELLSPLFGFPFGLISSTTNTGRNFPPYNILRFKDGSCRLDLAVAGYTKDRLSVEKEAENLIIRGKSADTALEPDCIEVSKNGICNSAWVRIFDINQNFVVNNVELHDGLLSITMQCEEVNKPKTTFEIK